MSEATIDPWSKQATEMVRAFAALRLELSGHIVDDVWAKVEAVLNTNADQITALQSELSRLKQEREWRPIESAPKEELFFGLDAARRRPFIAFWRADEEFPYSYNGGAYFNDADLWKLTHWKPIDPLPVPPSEQSKPAQPTQQEKSE